MHSRSHRISYLTLAFTVATALIATCSAQEVASLDLTKSDARVDLRRPKASSPATGGYEGTNATFSCSDSTRKEGALRTSLVSLDRTHYRVGDEPTFEVTIENADSRPVRIPFSPHLADLQPKDPAQKFSYSELHITLWIAADEWSTSSGGGTILYGTNHHAKTMLTLKPGEWVRVIGKGHLTLEESLAKITMSDHSADHVYAEASVYREETLITPTQSATVSREVCLAKTRGQSVPIHLTVP